MEQGAAAAAITRLDPDIMENWSVRSRETIALRERSPSSRSDICSVLRRKVELAVRRHKEFRHTCPCRNRGGGGRVRTEGRDPRFVTCAGYGCEAVHVRLRNDRCTVSRACRSRQGGRRRRRRDTFGRSRVVARFQRERISRRRSSSLRVNFDTNVESQISCIIHRICTLDGGMFATLLPR